MILEIYPERKVLGIASGQNLSIHLISAGISGNMKIPLRVNSATVKHFKTKLAAKKT